MTSYTDNMTRDQLLAEVDRLQGVIAYERRESARMLIRASTPATREAARYGFELAHHLLFPETY